MSRAWFSVVAIVAIVGCNALTGVGDYGSTFCTSSGVDSCASICAGKGGTWTAANECICASGAPLCGPLDDIYGFCCAADQFCEVDPEGHPFCQQCSNKCGSICCNEARCLDSTTEACGVAYGAAKQSCAGGLTCAIAMADGTTANRDCCDSIEVPAGTFGMGRSTSGKDACPPGVSCDPVEEPETAQTMRTFTLDTFEVTVGRFRAFVNAWDFQGLPIGAGGDAVRADLAWERDWNAALPKTRAELEKDLSCMNDPAGASPGLATWTSAPGAHENLPINCVSWYEAFAFCVWDGGRLPLEAEWEMAAANGAANDLYPWGEEAPSPARAVYDAAGPQPVGSLAGGASALGHRDLAGNVAEWTRDSFAPLPTAAGTEYASIAPQFYGFPVYRGGSFLAPAELLRAASRGHARPDVTSPGVGFRCARRR